MAFSNICRHADINSWAAGLDWGEAILDKPGKPLSANLAGFLVVRSYKLHRPDWIPKSVSVDLFRRRSSLSVTQCGSGTCLGPINLLWDRCLSLHVERGSISSLPPAGSWSTSTVCHTVWLPAVPASQPQLNQLHFLCKVSVNILNQTRVRNGPKSDAALTDRTTEFWELDRFFFLCIQANMICIYWGNCC